MSSFSITRKKTPFQKHREEEEAKKKRAEDETARLYEEFVASFQGDNSPGSKAFVRGGTINPNEKLKSDSEGEKSKDGVSVPKKGSRYVPSFIPPPLAAKGKESEKKEEERLKEKEKGKSRNIDHFMEELKHEQEMRERRNQDREHWRDGHHSDSSAPSSRFDELPDDFDPSGKLPGSFDDGDPQTTNLYVGNLSPKVDENFLLRTFGRFGPIASVKIMWPRTEEERRRQRNCGFVAFMNRADGQAAKDEMQGVVVYEYELKIGWGKSVALPSQALPAPPPGHMAIRSKEGGSIILSGPSGPPVTSVPNQNSELVLTPNVPDIMVSPPEDGHLRFVIDTMALYVLDGGCAFEQAIMEKGRGNPLFSFLFELGSKEHTYYVWRVYSFAQGDTLQRWRTEPFIMITGSGRWVPPPLPTTKSPDHEKDSTATYAAGRSRRVEPERTLTDPQRDEFEDMLRALTLERSQIKEAMGFALDNADAAGEERVLKVLQVWSDWFLFSDAYVNGLRATFLRSGNSGVAPFHSICGDAPEIEKKTSSEDVVDGIKANQDAALAMGKGAAMKELMDLPLAEVERRCRHNGLSLVGGREIMVARLLSLEDAEKQRSYELDDELKLQSSSSRFPSGQRDANAEPEPMELSGWTQYVEDEIHSKRKGSVPQAETLPISHPEQNVFTKKDKIDPVWPASKWAREDDDSDDEEKRSTQGLGLSYSSSGSENAGDGPSKVDELEFGTDVNIPAPSESAMNEEQRQKLRRLEVALIEYRESLEERGNKNAEDIERRVAIHRKRLESEYGLSDSSENISGRKRISLERRDRQDDMRDSSRKRHRSQSQSESPPRKSSNRERAGENGSEKDPERHRDRDRSHDLESERGRDRERDRREKSGSRERNDHDRDRGRERERDRRKANKMRF
ncbi:protein RRC1-like isoform X2 [Durio zibethinus]|uniref:Protein RRC1-like isoform X2 n=1 Tax=Durio zibethinus TaxID=66656 RepID=A0A6P5ZBW1_DURZI|nr:protein RRC1-like isoform X2 [Durio zibethinus]